ncbi:hypothetical protein [Chitinophaga alhagiae]|uniref:hypothetical protein n=1 Tax=Chitinophaga alhagiae TaxID=2203219 RepID=UPI00130070B7|nr:hypothetical protein [Chitinophaga alhagiae]
MTRYYLLCLLSVPCFFSCGTTKTISKVQLQAQAVSCAPTTPRNYVWQTPDLHRPLTPAMLARFSKKSWQLASLLGIEGELLQLMQLEEKGKAAFTTEDRLQWLELKQHVAERVDLASLEISATAAELDCEEERADQYKELLREKVSKAERKITVAAIITGAATGLLVGVMNLSNNGNENLSEEIAITGGIAEATLGILSLKIDRNIVFSHGRNHLQDIWFGADSTNNFPPLIWYYLNLPFNAGAPSLRESLKAQWLSMDQLSLKDRGSLYFGEGGKYSADELDDRSAMLDQLEARISLMKKDLQLITKELIEGKPGTAD